MKKAKGSTGRRYSESKRKKIIAFVESQGRGGMARAKEKFGVSYIALNRWIKGTGSKPGRKGKTVKGTKVLKIKGLKGILGQVRKAETNLQNIKARLAKLS